MLSSRRLGKIFLGLAVSMGLLVYCFWNADLRAVAARLRETLWTFLALSVALNFFSLWVRALRWSYLFPPRTHPTHLFRALVIGYMGNNVLPLRAGELLRIYVASRHGQRFWTIFATVVVERVLDGLAVGLMMAGLVLLVPIPAEVRWAIGVFLVMDLAGILVLVVVTVAPGVCRVLIKMVFRRIGWLERRLLGMLGTMTEGLPGVRAAGHTVPTTVSSGVS